MDARADPRRPRGDRRRRRTTAPKPTGCTARASPCSRPIIRARPRCSTPRRGSPAISPAPASSRPPRRCSATSSIRSPTPATCRRASPTCFGPMSTCCSKKGGDPAATAEMFAATQLMVRPGLAQTQAVLARELTGGTDEASRLFRQSVTLTRQIERARIELARLRRPRQADPAGDGARARSSRLAVADSQKEQLATQAALGSFPRYRAVSSDVIALADLQKIAAPGRGLLPDDDRRRSRLRDAGHPDDARARSSSQATSASSSTSRSTRCARPSRRSRTASA